jgi:polyhydroxybutyrate depolymerase
MMAFADAFKFILVAPRGFMFSWNDGSGFSPAGMSDIDDVTFVADMIEEVSQDYCIHPKRIFATGLSNGAAMSYHLACELSELIAAVGPVAGPDASAVLGEECPASRPISVIGFNGTADIFVPWSGGPGFWPGVTYPPVPVWIDEVAARNGCSEETEVVYQKGDVTCIAYQDCEDNAVVQHCSVEGGGHNWPGAVDLYEMDPDLYWFAGHTTQDIDASRAVWKFFAEHAMCDDDCECDEE